jgi:hypothetical protein
VSDLQVSPCSGFKPECCTGSLSPIYLFLIPCLTVFLHFFRHFLHIPAQFSLSLSLPQSRQILMLLHSAERG